MELKVKSNTVQSWVAAGEKELKFLLLPVMGSRIATWTPPENPLVLNQAW